MYTKIQTGLSDAETVSVKVYDLTGKSVLILENVVSNTDLDVSTFKKGIYFVRIENGSYVRTSKLIISR
jgi:hypothetical protein